VAHERTPRFAMPARQRVHHRADRQVLRRHGEPRRALVRHDPQERVQRLFASFPPLHTPRAEALGFHHDGSADALVLRATLR
jgi:hypothetical protein